jgi:hypothetical protein
MGNSIMYKYISLTCFLIAFSLLIIILIDYNDYGYLSMYFIITTILGVVFATMYRKGLGE